MAKLEHQVLELSKASTESCHTIKSGETLKTLSREKLEPTNISDWCFPIEECSYPNSLELGPPAWFVETFERPTEVEEDGESEKVVVLPEQVIWADHKHLHAYPELQLSSDANSGIYMLSSIYPTAI